MKTVKTLLGQIADIADFFNIGSPIKIKQAGGGANANFFVNTIKGNYFIKITLEPHTRSNKLREALYVKHASNHGLPAPAYLFGQDKSFLFEGNGIIAMAQNAIPGSNPDITISSASQIGELLGKTSLIPSSKLPHRDSWLKAKYVKDSTANLNRNFTNNPSIRKILSVYNSCGSFVKNILPNLPQGLIHTDLHSENVLFKNGKLIAVVDWEDATVSALLLDFVSSAAYWCFNGKEMRPRIYKAFYEGYTKKRPLTKLELEYLDDCMKYVGVAQTMWRFLNYPEGDEEALWGLELADYKMPIIK